MIALLDQDNHTVRMSKEEIAQSIAMMGNGKGQYLFVHIDEAVEGEPMTVLRIVPYHYPRCSWFQKLHKWLKKSELLSRKIPMTYMGKRGYVEEQAKPVWLRLKNKETHIIYVA